MHSDVAANETLGSILLGTDSGIPGLETVDSSSGGSDGSPGDENVDGDGGGVDGGLDADVMPDLPEGAIAALATGLGSQLRNAGRLLERLGDELDDDDMQAFYNSVSRSSRSLLRKSDSSTHFSGSGFK